jgi:starch-binding outer membrane protein, SusD/RagB family
MKKYLYLIMAAMVFLIASCENFLDVSSPSTVDADFVFSAPSEAYKTVMGCYDLWRDAYSGLFYDLDVVGSDAECHPETYDAQTRHIPEGLYASELAINFADGISAWGTLYKIANRANMIMQAISAKADYQSAVASNTPNDWTQLYGEAAVFRAYCYFTLIRYWGDVPYFDEPIITTEQTDSAKLVSRDIIYDAELTNLKKAEVMMYRLGEHGITAERFSRTFAQGLIGKMALYAGGYGLRRTDFDYGTITFTQLGTEMWNAKYVRRTDYKNYYDTALKYLKELELSPGSANLITNDSRGAGYGNPFQRNYQYNMDLVVSPESLYEIGFTQGVGNSERPYAFGRPSGGGGSNAYPCKSYGQSRLAPAFYYGDYDTLDLRRDVTVTVTANSGSCTETLISFAPGSKNLGGLPNNKWDESRMAKPYTAGQRKSGINWPQMRMADVILMLAEVYAELGDEPNAKTELTKVRNRAFASADQPTKVINYISTLSGDALKEAIQQERKLEFAGEGFRRYDLIRTGKLPEKIKAVRDLQTAMVAGLTTNGYYTFPNGATISNYIYVKKVNVGDLGMTKMLTTQCTVANTDPTWPVRFPNWRGNCDLWAAQNYLPTSGTRNLAIQGLFKYINPAGLQAAALVAAGYVKTAWGTLITGNAAQYTTNVFKGYTDAYYSTGVPPRYFLPLSAETISLSNGLITNGYGFAQQ